jgi:sulfite reductase beta subunit-like hemoprotein
VAKEVIAALGEQGRSLAWAISGCPNSCAQPQLAEAGIIAVKSVREEDGARRPLFDLYRREGEELGRAVRHGLDLAGLLQASSDLG